MAEGVHDKQDTNPLGALDVFDVRAPSWLPRDPNAPPGGLDACLADIGVAVIETDAQGRVVGLNAVAERLTGYASEEKRGAPLDEVFRFAAPDSTSSDAMLARELGVVPPRHSALLERRDGQVIPVRHVVGVAPPRPLPAGEPAPKPGRLSSSAT